MTVREKDVYNYIVQFKTVNGYSPTVREIAEGIHTASLTSVKDILERLKDKDVLTYEDKKPRTIVIKKFNIE
jgi:repressor LexA